MIAAGVVIAADGVKAGGMGPPLIRDFVRKESYGASPPGFCEEGKLWCFPSSSPLVLSLSLLSLPASESLVKYTPARSGGAKVTDCLCVPAFPSLVFPCPKVFTCVLFC